ncbi:hypothetical protein [Methylobacterium sp. J-067]|uniref:hypothetical protein n=1 Tax=Methylobacterium sp. J-067 TaxID=2836648 RepID=UPI001FBAD6D1|nr:hypothetical protein [Methylobacterium sp. J-067]
MTTAPVTMIAVPDSVLNAVGEALESHLKVLQHKRALHRDEADRVLWALESYRLSRFRNVQAQVRMGLAGMDGLSPETKAELKDFIEKCQDAMPRSKRNAAEWTAHKAELKRAREAQRPKRPRRLKTEAGS